MCWTGHCIWTKAHPTSMSVMCSTARTSTARWHPSRKRHWKRWASTCPTRTSPSAAATTARSPLMPPAGKCCSRLQNGMGWNLEEEAEYGNRKYLEKQDFILAKQKEQLAAQQSKLDELTLKVSDMETLLEECFGSGLRQGGGGRDGRGTHRDPQGRYADDRGHEEVGAVPGTQGSARPRESTPPTVWTPCWTSSSRPCRPPLPVLQEKLLKPEVRQKGKEQVKEKARDSVLQLLNRLQAEQAQRNPSALSTAEKSENRFQ